MKRHRVLITYDVGTPDRAGARRLKKVATLCEGYGQRVQYSVFECRMTEMQLDVFEHRLMQLIDPEADSIRVYLLPGDEEGAFRIYGLDRSVNFDDPMVL